MPKSLFNLSGKVAVVTGGAGLLGSAISEGLALQGAKVIIAEKELRRAKNRLKKFKGSGGRVHALEMDISNPDNVRAGIREILHRFRKIDIWVNNAYPRTSDWGNVVEKISESSWNKNVEDHLGGYFFCCRQVAEAMKKRKKGVIINMASIYGSVAPDFSIYEGTKMTMPVAYSAIKAGIINLTHYLASYYGSSGIRVNTISPGGIQNGQPKTFVRKYSRKTAVKRMAKPQDVVGAVVYLASDSASYVTGHNLIVDGGFTVT